MKKQLLNEQEIRKFMKFANIGTLSEDFINRVNEEEAPDIPDADIPDVDVPEPDQEEDAEVVDIEGAAEVSDEEASLGLDKSQAEDVLAMVVDKLADALGIDVEVESADDEAPEEPPMDEPMDMGPEAEEAEAELAPSPEMEEPEEEMGSEEEPVMEDLVNEVAKRVAGRLLKESKR